MKNKVILVLISVLILLSMILASCASSATSSTQQPVSSTPSQSTTNLATSSSIAVTTSSPSTATSTTGADWWDTFGTPQYGGTITQQMSSFMPDLDPYSSWGGFYSMYLDPLFHWNWKVNPKVWGFTTSFTPPDYIAGNLAKSWSWTDPTTLTIDLQQGVHWQDKAPLNGREFTADDVAFHYDRMLGTGYGYTTPSPVNAGRLPSLKTVTATDKYTVQFIFKYPTAVGFLTLLDLGGQNLIEPQEWVALGGPPSSSTSGPPAGGPPGGGPPGGAVASGPLADWHTAVGDGPWILANYVSGSSITYDKNPNYWGHDERFPQNQLPYADVIKVLIIPDSSTALAALRTGQIDILSGVTWQNARTLSKSNPDLEQASNPAGGQSIDMRVDVKPFTDLRVREALQLAIDTNTIAKTYYGGTVAGTPCGMVNPVLNKAGYGFAYQDWPQSLKDEYAYNPTKAKQLLAEAGYPDGFKTDLVAPSVGDTGLMQIIKSEFADIGVTMDINLMDMTAWMPLASARKEDQMNWDPMGKTGAVVPITTTIDMFNPTDAADFGNINDPKYTDLVTEFNKAATLDEAKQYLIKADQYALENHFWLSACTSINYNIWQPYLKGYSGQTIGAGGGGGDSSPWARIWLTQK